MILKALMQWLNTLLKFINSCKSRGPYNAGYNSIMLYQDQTTISGLNGKLQIKKCYETFISICSEFTRFHCLKFLNYSRIRNQIRHRPNYCYRLLVQFHLIVAFYLEAHSLSSSTVFQDKYPKLFQEYHRAIRCF